MTYASSRDVWDWLNAFSTVRFETSSAPTTGDNIRSLSNSSLITSSLNVYVGTAGSVTTLQFSATLSSVTDYTVNLDDGIITFTTSGSNQFTGSGGKIPLYSYDYAPIKDSTIQKFLTASDAEVNRRTGRIFTSSSTLTQYFDVENGENSIFYTKRYPVITISEVAVNQNAADATPDWKTLSAGLGNDYLTDSDNLMIGRLQIIDNFPQNGFDRVRIKYDPGYTAIPTEINRLSTLLTVKEIISNPSFAKSIIEGQGTFIPLNLNVINAEIDKNIEQMQRYKYSLV